MGTMPTRADYRAEIARLTAENAALARERDAALARAERAEATVRDRDADIALRHEAFYAILGRLERAEDRAESLRAALQEIKASSLVSRMVAIADAALAGADAGRLGAGDGSCRQIIEVFDTQWEGMRAVLLSCGHRILAPDLGITVGAIPCSVCIIVGASDAGRGAGEDTSS